MSNLEHVTDQLSLFLDGRLNRREQARLEEHLRACVDCRRQLATLRYSVSLMKQAPPIRAPRSFTLSDEQAARALPRWQSGWLYQSLRGLTAFAAVMFLVVFSADILSTSRFGVSAPSSAQTAPATSAPFNAVPAPQAAEDNQSKSVATTAAAAAPVAPAGPSTRAVAQPTAPASAPPALPATSGVAKPTTVAGTAESVQPTTAPVVGGPAAAVSPQPTATAIPIATPAPSVEPASAPTPEARVRLGELPWRAVEVGLLGVVVLSVGGLLALRIYRA